MPRTVPPAVPGESSGAPSQNRPRQRGPNAGRADDPPASLLDDLAQAAAGDEPAADRVLRALYVRVRTRVRRRLARYPAHVVADAVQEAMVRVIAYLPRCRAASDRQLVRWALLVGWHAALRYVRSPAAGMAIGWDGVPIHFLVRAGDEASARPDADGPAWDDPDGPDARAADGAESGGAGPGGSGAAWDEPESGRPAWGEPSHELTLGPWVRVVCPDPDTVLAWPARLGGGPDGGTGGEADHEGAWAGEIPAAADLLWALLAGAVADEAREHVVLVWERAALGRTYQEVAAARGITPGAAKQRYQRTVVRLRRAVAARAARLPEPLRAVALRHAATLRTAV